ncbi:AMP-binding protein [uncultured Hyphomonas sp.]|uniref:class I adenylate-forming enzyme family protein n=1 Tax=uncultured Hyphomonas sp. TaxID=225298 RepID=UPI002AAC2ABC|nr:AMP-binding protein [uncultured Hyphomonas sp.]
MTPESAADECLTVPGCLEWTSSFFPEEIALADEGRCIRYRELDDNTRAAASCLLSRWVSPGDKVAVIGENSAAHMQVLYSVFRSGCCLVPLSTFLSSEAAARILDDADVQLVIAGGDYLNAAQKAIGLCRAKPNLIGLDELELAAQAQPLISLPDIDPSTDAIIVYSSGTTGTPKGIVGSHALRALQTKGFAALGAEPGRYTLLSTPLASNWTLAGLFSTLWNGGAVYIARRFRALAFIGLAEQLQPKITFLVPTQIERLLEQSNLAEACLAEDCIKLCAGSPIAPDKKLAFHRTWPGSFIEIYSMTESTVTCSLDVGQHPDKARSVGVPAEGYRIAILGDDDRELPPGEVGEIAGWSQYMMKAYFKRETATAELRWAHPDGTIFHRTGDLGFLDSDGFLHISGRKKDMIITGGFNVYPSDLEAVLCSHPQVKEAAVIGLPCPRWGETPFAVITCRDPDTVTRSELLEWANGHLGKTQRLSGLDIVEGLPRGSLQKVLKAELRRTYAATEQDAPVQETQNM